MPIIVPQPGQDIDATLFGKPVADELNRITPLVIAPTAWVNCTMLNGWAALGAGYRTPRYRKISDLVYVEAYVSATAPTSDTMFQMPTGFRPPLHLQISGSAYSGGPAMCSVTFQSDGNVLASPRLNHGFSIVFSITA